MTSRARCGPNLMRPSGWIVHVAGSPFGRAEVAGEYFDGGDLDVCDEGRPSRVSPDGRCDDSPEKRGSGQKAQGGEHLGGRNVLFAYPAVAILACVAFPGDLVQQAPDRRRWGVSISCHTDHSSDQTESGRTTCAGGHAGDTG